MNKNNIETREERSNIVISRLSRLAEPFPVIFSPFFIKLVK